MNKCPKCGSTAITTLYEYNGGAERLKKLCPCGYEWFSKTLDQNLEEEPLMK